MFIWLAPDICHLSGGEDWNMNLGERPSACAALAYTLVPLMQSDFGHTAEHPSIYVVRWIVAMHAKR